MNRLAPSLIIFLLLVQLPAFAQGNFKKCDEWQTSALKYLYNQEYEKTETKIKKVLIANKNSRNDIIIASSISPRYGMVSITGGSLKWEVKMEIMMNFQ